MFSELERDGLERALGAFCEARAPARVRDRVRLEFSIEGHTVTLVEARVGPLRPSRWSASPVARFRYRRTSNDWILLYSDRNGRWHEYEGGRSPRFDDLLAEVDRDPTCIFWG